MNIKTATFIFTLFISSLIATETSNLDKWFDKMNIISAHNASTFIADTALGVNFLGGAGVMRGKVFDLNPVHIQLPQFSSGCGGISYAMGAINLASSDEVVKAIKAILSNAQTYAFKLALHTATPIIASISGDLQTYANAFNGININSCNISRSLVNAAWPAKEHASNFICEHGGSNTLFSGHIEKRHNCSKDRSHKGNPQTKIEQKLRKESDLLTGNYNIAWKVFNKMSGLSQDEKDLFLNLTGTIIRIEGTCKIFPSKGKEAWEAIINGGTIKRAYAFSPTQEEDLVYAGVKEKDFLITDKQAWGIKMLNAMKTLQEKIKTGRTNTDQTSTDQYTMTSEEKSLLQGTKVQMGTLLVVNARKDGASKIVSLSDYARLEAFERLYNFFTQALSRSREIALSLIEAQVNTEDLEKYLQELERVKKELNFERIAVQKQINDIHQFEKFLREKDDYQRALGEA